MSNLNAIFSSSSKQFVARLDNEDRARLAKYDLMWSDYSPDDELLECCNNAGVDISSINDSQFDDYLKMCLNELRANNFEFTLAPCYKHLVA